MTEISQEITDSLIALADPVQASHLMRFFKTGKGQYGEGDKFLGIRVPQTRSIVRNFRKKVAIPDILSLVKSPWHEIRLAGFLLLIELFHEARKRGEHERRQVIIDFYLQIIDRGNNWDLVDLVAPKLLGQWLIDNQEHRDILYDLASSDNLWRQRVAIVSTLALIKEGQFSDTFKLAEYYLSHSHDLIHKATGWMLREIGKRGGEKELIEFLAYHKTMMPRTMYRYAIERLPSDKIPL